jgi:hypothetical protein
LVVTDHIQGQVRLGQNPPNSPEFILFPKNRIKKFKGHFVQNFGS